MTRLSEINSGSPFRVDPPANLCSLIFEMRTNDLAFEKTRFQLSFIKPNVLSFSADHSEFPRIFSIAEEIHFLLHFAKSIVSQMREYSFFVTCKVHLLELIEREGSLKMRV